MISPVSVLWRELWHRGPTCADEFARRALWLQLWPECQQTPPCAAMAGVHPLHRARATQMLCELGAAWSALHRVPLFIEREQELWLWEAAHNGDTRALDEWARTAWNDDFFAHPTHRFAELLRASGRADDFALRVLWRSAAPTESSHPLTLDYATQMQLQRVAGEDSSWQLRLKLRALSDSQNRTGF